MKVMLAPCVYLMTTYKFSVANNIIYSTYELM